METQSNCRKLDALFLSVKDRLKTAKWVEVTPYEMRDALQVTLWHLWYGDQGAVIAKAREVAKGHGLDFECRVMTCGRDAVIFRRYGH